VPSDSGVLATSARNLSEQAHQVLKRDILAAAYLPGERLRLDSLSARYGIGVVPLREALNRLSSEGFVERQSQRGFMVAPMSLPALEELVKTRIWLETKALTESIKAATDAWEERVIVAFHRLERTQRMIDAERGERLNQTWEDLHKEFHMQLISGCGSSWLLEFCSTMMDQAVRYRNLSVNFTKARRGDAISEHRDILDAVLDRDGDRSAALLEAHYRRTVEGLRPIIL
jgi:GntR family transcriptional regulator, carbon starvation induced regulator